VSDGLQAVERAADLLSAMAQASGPVGVRELSVRMGFSKSSVHRILVSLESRGFVEMDPVSCGYRLGVRAMEVGLAVVDQMELDVACRPFLEELLRHTNETVNLAILDEADGQVVYLVKLEPAQSIRINTRLGARRPAHSTALGKALLAELEPGRLESILRRGPLAGLTGRTITDPEELMSHLQLCRERGYAVDDEEFEEGIICVAAPVRGYGGSASTAVSVSSPGFRTPPGRVDELGELVRSSARDISRRLGYISTGD
jgi:IclR family transcriptional regulator, KDG regulon repressor